MAALHTHLHNALSAHADRRKARLERVLREHAQAAAAEQTAAAAAAAAKLPAKPATQPPPGGTR